MKSKISIHFDGPITVNHAVQLRTFSKTLGHVQTAIDRAYLDLKYGNVWKNARLKNKDYPHTEFFMQQTRDGGLIADLLGEDGTGDIAKRVHDAVLPAYEKARGVVVPDHPNLAELAEQRRLHFENEAQEATPYVRLLENPDPAAARAYGDRSIVKEFDQIASVIRARKNDGSFVEFDIHAGNALPKLVFDAATSIKFHDVVSIRALGDPIKLKVKLRALDAGNGGISKAKAYNILSKKDFNLHIHTDRGFGILREYLEKRNAPIFTIVGCPVLEYGAFDPLAGDIYFIAVVEDDEPIDDIEDDI